MFGILKSFIRDKSGATIVEYGLIAALVSVVAVSALGTMGGNLTTMFGHVAGCMTQAQQGVASC
jgi:pilus assembly protein Flp/PilA